jgi:hypothetical protein
MIKKKHRKYDAELEDHLDEDRVGGVPNRRNGRQIKPIRTESGEVSIEYGLIH